MKLKIICILALIQLEGCVFDCKNYLDTNIKPRYFYGQVVNMYEEETGCFGSIVLKNGNTFDTLSSICYCVPASQKVWDNVKIGDSLLKRKDELVIKVISSDKVRRFAYPCCNH